jgi:hypothetical protein
MTSQCPDSTRLSAYYDGELDDEARRVVELHVKGCPACAAELEKLHGVSQLFGSMQTQPLGDDELARLHGAVDQSTQAVNRSAMRIAGFLMMAAASIMLICGAWLVETPGASHLRGGAGVQVRVPSMPEWERVAITLRTDPLPGDDRATKLADDSRLSRLADWMVQQLQDSNGNFGLP